MGQKVQGAYFKNYNGGTHIDQQGEAFIINFYDSGIPKLQQ